MTAEERDTGFEALLERLCRLFDDELERQENVLALCRAQGEAVRAHDVEAMEGRTRALVVLVEDAKKAERERIEILRRVVEVTGLPEDRQTLSDLISAVPGPWNDRMAEFQSRIRRTLGDTRAVARENAALMRHSLRVVNRSVRTATGADAVTETYDAEGRGPFLAGRAPAVLDAQG